jgi:ABC-2 type transport system ATP-binding protein
VVAFLGLTVDAAARDVVVRSFDGTPILAHFYPSPTAGPGARAATVLVGSGYPASGDTRPDLDQSDIIGTKALLSAGYNVLTWDPRGLGGSGGSVMFNSPSFEARDVQALIDFVAAQPEALLDAARDPRLGMSGSSYGGAIQFVVAAIDARVDVLVPDLSWHSLVDGFAPAGNVKMLWMALVCNTGILANAKPSIFGPAGLQLGSQDPRITLACAEGISGRGFSPATVRFFEQRGLQTFARRVRVPTLVSQATTDVLFSLRAGIANFEAVRATGAPVKMIWHCGGHGVCPSAQAYDRRHLAQAALTWLRRWLDRDVIDTGALLEWQDDAGHWRSSERFPLPRVGALDASGSGALTITPLDIATAGVALYPAPASEGAVEADFPAPPPDSTVLGAPTVSMTYHGTAVPAHTFAYAQIVDVETNTIVGSQITPLPVVLDGRTRTLQHSLEPLAAHARSSSRYRLQITGATSLFAAQTAAGLITIERLHGTLPLADPGAQRIAASALRTPRRLRLSATTRRVGRAAWEIVVRSRLRSKPCSGRVTITLRHGHARRTVRTRVRRDCSITRVVQVSGRHGQRIRISARFDGNAELMPRRAVSIQRRLR